MKKLAIIFVVATIAACGKVDSNTLSQITPSINRSLSEATYWAEKSISLIEPSTKYGASKRKIKSWDIVTSPLTKSDSFSADTLLYVFNFEDNNGFSIISASNSIQPIIAVTESGTYTPGESTGNTAFDDYMDSTIEQILSARDSLELYYWYDYEMVGDEHSRLVNVNWGQVGETTQYSDAFYGKYCSNHIAGCAPVAIAQIMSYHAQPQSFVASCDMNSDYLDGDTIVLNWSNINLHLHDHDDTRGCTPYHNTIAALMREVGRRAGTTYGTNKSGTNIANIKSTMESFGYTCSDTLRFSNFRVKNAIRNMGPVLIFAEYLDSESNSSRNTNSGHTWILDAYKDYTYSYCRYERAVGDGSDPIVTNRQIIDEAHMYHFNWGYDGRCNGWFAIIAPNGYNTSSAESYDNNYDNTINKSYDASEMLMWTITYNYSN